MPKPEQEPDMHLRFPPTFAILVSFFMHSASVHATDVASRDTYALKTFGSAGRYAVASIDRTWLDTARNRGVPVRIYYPANGADDEKFPTIVFSTGLGRSRDDCAYLGRHWASCGYVSVHVQHKGSDQQVRQNNIRPRKELQKAFYSPDNIRNRPLDVIFAIDRLEAMQRHDKSPADRCDLSRIGVSGHDFGAQTVLGLAGQVLPGKLEFSEPRIKAVVAMSAPVPLGQVPLDMAYANVSRPCLHITGTADNSIVGTTKASQRRLSFDDAFGADQYLVTLNGADHMTYSGHILASNGTHDAMFQRLIAECSTVFWDAYLRKDAAARAWLNGGGLRAHLGAAGRMEEKLAADRPPGG
jgi:hypothetical protein